ncbi:hypothetical protein BLA29_012380 [Euroglyphus maynei]|uniref:Uncharacterized protein n=1 Tax=Euroglyphus maynei TaxID=6958 RepID=A0A1Y3AXR2_EURMA|nr:hypothetical protein BLA29_012380 [Euroglyphus maynei]
MDNRQSRIAKYYSTSLSHWDYKIFDRLDDSNFRNTVRYVFYLEFIQSFIIVTNDWRTFVYGQQLCSWLSLIHRRSSVQEIREFRYLKLKQIDWGHKLIAILTENGNP